MKELEKCHPGQNFDWVHNFLPGQSFLPGAGDGDEDGDGFDELEAMLEGSQSDS